jgi:hypothetical protein
VINIPEYPKILTAQSIGKTRRKLNRSSIACVAHKIFSPNQKNPLLGERSAVATVVRSTVSYPDYEYKSIERSTIVRCDSYPIFHFFEGCPWPML